MSNYQKITHILRTLPSGTGRDAMAAAGITSEDIRNRSISDEQVWGLYVEADSIRAERGTRSEQVVRQRAADRSVRCDWARGDADDIDAGLQSPGAGGGIPSGREFS